MATSEPSIAKLTPPKALSEEECRVIYEYFLRHVANHRNEAERYANLEEITSKEEGAGQTADKIEDSFVAELNRWANETLKHAWVACKEPGNERPLLSPVTDTSTRDLPPLPTAEQLSQVLNTVLLLHLTQTKGYSPHTRVILQSFGSIDEAAAAATLKDPRHALENASHEAEEAKAAHSAANSTWRKIGIGAGALAGGVLVGVSGGLAAPLVGAGVSTLLGALGAGGTAAGILATGLASSSAVCGALFGAYGARSASNMISRHTRDVNDFDIIPIRQPKETLAIRICVSGWVSEKNDVTAPWTIFGDDQDTFALQWELEALQKLSNALTDLIKSQAMSYVKGEIIKRTVLAALMSSLSPTAWLKFGKIIDNPWANVKALAEKTGKVLGTLLAVRAFGARPVTLVGYSLGSLVIYHALAYLAERPPEEVAHLIQDVYLFGSPAPTDSRVWTAARRIVAGRLVNGYAKPEDDYVLAVLSRFSVSSATGWGVSGLQPIEVAGVENVQCEGIRGHVAWRGMIGKCLSLCHAPGLVDSEVVAQERDIAGRIDDELDAIDRKAEAERDQDEPAEEKDE